MFYLVDIWHLYFNKLQILEEFDIGDLSKDIRRHSTLEIELID